MKTNNLSRAAGRLYVLIAVLGGAVLAGPAAAQSSGGGANGTDQVFEKEHNWERIPLRYIDVRVVAAILGARVLPTEAQLYGGMFGGGFGGFQGGFGGMGGGMGGFGGQGGGFAAGNSPLFPGLIILADPNTNSILVDP